MSDLLINSLTGHYQKDKLAGLFILRPPKSKEDTDLKIWLNGLLSHFAGKDISLGHPDITWCSPPEKANGPYSVDDQGLKDFNRALLQRPYQLKRHFIIIENIKDLTTVIVNKLLKSLEEPPDYVCIWLLDPQDRKYLETLESRAIALRLKLAHTPKEIDEFSDNVRKILVDYSHKVIALDEAINLLEKSSADQTNPDALDRALDEFYLESLNNYEGLQNALTAIRQDLRQKEFHQSFSVRLAQKIAPLVP